MNVTRTRVWMAVFIGLVFVCGFLVGGTAGMLVGPRHLAGVGLASPPPERPAGPRRPGFRAERILNRLAREDPDFTDEQRARLEALFAGRRQAFERVAREMRERYAAEQEALRARVAEILTPGQMEIFDDARRRRRGPGPGRERRGNR